MNAKYYGVDVSKDHLDVACEDRVERIENSKAGIRKFIKRLPEGSVVGMEATNTYHLLLADLCYSSGMRVYVVNPRVTRHYRVVRGLRGHTDRMDALTLSSFIEAEHAKQRPYEPLSTDQRKLRTLIKRRSKLVTAKVQIEQSMRGVKDVARELKAVLERMEKLIEKTQMLIDALLDSNDDRSRITTIPGVGTVVSAVLVADLDCCDFRSADAFVAFYGLDPRPNDSGRSRGRRKLSKQGQKLGRTQLYNAAMSASITTAWHGIYMACLDRGLSKVQALIVIARKIARAAWSIYTHKTTFNAERLSCA